jgi:RHS repeat-associated protein
MGRLNTMADAGEVIIQGATYGPANELLTITGGTGSTPWAGETRIYNSLKQLTSILTYNSSPVSIAYNYPSPSGNNGKIVSQTDNNTGETVTYAYDALNRLASAATQSNFSTPWGQSFTYDGFGNLTNVNVTQGSAPTLAVSYDPSTNHPNAEGLNVDANGNPGYIPVPADGGTNYMAAYDVENRLTGVTGTLYSYAPGNKRIWRGNASRTLDVVTFWSVSGQKLAEYSLTTTTSSFYATQTETNYYFGSKLIKNGNGWVYSDRLGSVGKFYPYGIERPSATTNGTEKFTGYFRDNESGNDYAVNRYMSPGMGRFITPDRGMGGAKSGDPGTWNKYAYTGGDPINRVDRHGSDYEDCDSDGDCWTVFTSEVDEMEDQEFEYDPGTPCFGSDQDDPTCAAFLNTIGLVSNFYTQFGPAQSTAQAQSNQALSLQLTAAMGLASQALDNPKCAALLGSGVSQGGATLTASQVLNLLYVENGMYGSIGFGPLPSQPGTITSAVTVPWVLNTGGATYNEAAITISTSPGSVWLTGNLQQQAILLLHELGHAMNDIFGAGTSGIKDDGSSTQAGIQQSMKNTKLIKKDCF